jgi:hypothetical protein
VVLELVVSEFAGEHPAPDHPDRQHCR